MQSSRFAGGPTEAARQAAALLALSAALALVGLPSQPHQVVLLLVIAGSDLGTAGVTLLLPWSRWGARSTAVLILPALVVLGVSTWAFGGFAAGTGPFFVLLFAWLGLHQPPRIIVGCAPLAALAYAIPLLAAGASPRLIGSTAVLIPIALAVGLIIAHRVRGLTAARLAIGREERWRSALMATLAHDVRSPLTTIRAALEIVGDDPTLSPPSQDILRSAVRQTARLARLSSGLLDLERVDAGRLRLDCRDIALAEVTDLLTELTGVRDLKVDVEPGLTVWADPDRLEQMLVNLTSNALRHGLPPVELTARRDREAVQIRLRDHGPGVPADDQELLFERLSAADRAAESVGLGLWIVRLLAEAHGGRVGYEPADPGARFTLTLPRHPAPVPVDASP